MTSIQFFAREVMPAFKDASLSMDPRPREAGPGS